MAITGPYGFSDFEQHASVLNFSNIVAEDICYSLLQHPGGAVAIGRMLVRAGNFVHVIQKGDAESDNVALTSFSIVGTSRTSRESAA